MSISITKAISMNVEELQQLEASQLAELHKLLADSKQKKALRKADLVAGILKAKLQAIKEQPQDEKQPVTAGAENSTKAPVKKPVVKKPVAKADPLTEALLNTPKKPVVKKPTADELKELAGENEPTGDQQPQQEKEPEPVKEPSFIRPQQEQPDLTKLSQEELLKYIAQLEAKAEKFPAIVEGEKTRYKRAEFENVQAIQQHLLKHPMSLFAFVDEKLDERKTTFLVLFASPEVLVILDRNRHKNSTTTIPMKDVTATQFNFPKDKQKFDYAFYIREKK
jgi:hypothetical protein